MTALTRLILLSPLLLAPTLSGGECLAPAAAGKLVGKIKRSIINFSSDHYSKSGFAVRSKGRDQAVTAHHNITTDPAADQETAQSAAECRRLANAPQKSEPFSMAQLKVGPLKGRYHQAKRGRARTVRPDFKIAPGRFDYGRDLVRAPLPSSAAELEAANRDQVPSIGETVYIAGFPEAKDEELQILKCKFIGFTGAVNTDAVPALQLHCPDVDFDIGGMSGGPVVSACSGKVVGAVSFQVYDGACKNLGTPQLVGAAPLFEDPVEGVSFGVGRPLHATKCVSSGGTYGPRGQYSVRDCQLIPGMFGRSGDPFLQPGLTPTQTSEANR